jgi:pimeloyl-ACP methyl ester carboxylesterase
MTGLRPLLLLATTVTLLAAAQLNAAASLTPVPCASITRLRSLAASPGLTYFVNSRTGDQLDYVVIGDGAVSSEVIVLFNGTSAILPDWPVQMLTNSTDSPLIVANPDYDPKEDSPHSLCHEYRIVLFDYPGTGQNPLASSFTGDQIANDVDAMLNDVTARYGISTAIVDPGGWSLGTNLALKYSFVAPMSNPARQLHSLLLIATRPGGNTDGFQSGNQAQCVTTVLDTLQSATPDFSTYRNVQAVGIKLIFPYLDEPPYSDSNDVCTAVVGGGSVQLNVPLDCTFDNHCDQTLEDDLQNRMTAPWSLTNGISRSLFIQERAFDNDYNICNCQTAEPGFVSSSCSCSGRVKSSPSNGGLCQVTSTIPWEPVISNCAPVTNSGPITVINGFQDLFIQWVYGQALVDGYQAGYGTSKAQIFTYPGIDGAGHGVLFQHPKWTQEHLFAALDQ